MSSALTAHSSKARPEMLRVLERVADGARLSREDGLLLMDCPGRELPLVMATAAGLVQTDVITYSRKVFIPLTNLCRDVCGYCTFARTDRDPKAKTLTPDEVLAIARAGQAAGCKEALFSLGERPEERYASMRDTLQRLGSGSTTEYLAAMCELVFKETGLLPHSNCGVLDRDELAMLREWNASIGLMLESSSERLLERGHAHWACPGKAPDVRLQTLRTAGELGMAFTSGILIGIGETRAERVDSILALRDLSDETGALQEVIVQNFRAKHDTRFRAKDEPSALEMARTIAVARLLLGGAAHVQAPPNLTPDAYGFYLLAGIDDWGGISPVTRDHINPEAAWPALDDLAAVTAEAGRTLRERLALYREWMTPRFLPPNLADRIRELDAAC